MDFAFQCKKIKQNINLELAEGILILNLTFTYRWWKYKQAYTFWQAILY